MEVYVRGRSMTHDEAVESWKAAGYVYLRDCEWCGFGFMVTKPEWNRTTCTNYGQCEAAPG